MNCISLKRSLVLEDDPQDTFSPKRKRMECTENNLKKLPEINNPEGTNCIAVKTFLSLEDNSRNIFSAKRKRRQCKKEDKHLEVPNNFLKGLPILLDTDSSDSEADFQTPQFKRTKFVTQQSKNLFSFNELKSICCNMMKKSEDLIREEYESSLTRKMAEQYDTFIKFTHDQMLKEIGQNASYLT
ncbi:uncharacterized protein [Drosophila takahashii]|uniref:uncharacterized protein n=1 Tax=Drosophila takahashii TaxID=29030 RepID=UPI001CF901D7|nr:uncharacterized protein LOC108065971 [Drosophila takahashii]